MAHCNKIKINLLRTITTIFGSGAVIGIVISPAISNAKTRYGDIRHPSLLKKTASVRAIREFEQRLSPYFEWKSGKRASQPIGQSISDIDMLLLARQWNAFSPEFKQLYLSSLSIPPGFQAYVSPGGHFEIYYTLSGDNAVSPSDTYGYSPSDWHLKISGPNSIPDYIDEVAWGFDSAWSMEISRFGFKPPHVFIDETHSSGRYKAVVLDIRDGNAELYGMTYPAGQVSGEVGMRSYIEIRNDWSGWELYRNRPIDAAHITCAHEFFHAIQYSMGHEEYPSAIDSFPVGWLEGTAVLMEDLAFDHVNDYLQYQTGYDGYFGNPGFSVLLDDYIWGVDPYANGVVGMFLYWRAFGAPSIAFIKSIFFRNEQAKQGFDGNASAAAVSAATTWPVVLNDFHRASFFTGPRVDTARFIPDAPLLDAWGYTLDSLDENFGVTKSIRPYAMQTFARSRAEKYADTMHILFTGDINDAGGKWAAGAILVDTAGAFSEMAMPLESPSTSRISIPHWGAYDTVIVVITNAHPALDRKATVFFTDFMMENLNLSESFDIYPNPVIRQSHGVLHIRGKSIIDVTLYAVDGKMVAYADVHTPSTQGALVATNTGFDWKLCNKAGEQVVPGSYIAIVGYKDIQENRLKRQRKTILVLP